MKNHTMKRARALAPTTMALALLAFAGGAQAVEFGGYFRGGPGATQKGASRACYGLAGPGLKYRLGNECDIYGEFMLGHTAKVDGVDYSANVMFNLWNPGTDTDSSKVGINQMYVQGKGFDVAPGANFWVGKRFYGRADVHIVDTFFVKMDGVGAGVDSIDTGVGKAGFAFFRTDGGATQPGSRINAELSDIAVNPGGKLRVLGTLTKGDFSTGTSGAGLTLQHNQENFLGMGGGNTVWLQFAQGSAGLDANFGDLTAASKVKGVRLVESFTWQRGPFGGQALALWQNDKDATGTRTTSISLGGRASYAMTRNFKLVSELGFSQKKPDGLPTQQLSKFTIAPTLSTGPGFWNRPELRLYVTTAKWNAAANAAAGAAGLTGNSDGKTRGTSYGVQVETWF
jgi:maltoporin